MSNLNSGTCAGCSCQTTPINCQTTVYGFTDAATCMSGQPGVNLGGWKTGSEGSSCSTMPNWLSLGTNDYTYGIAVDAFTPISATCQPSGSPTLKPPTWTATESFCNAVNVGGGCNAGSVCVPASSGSSVCQISDGSHACPAGTSTSVWYTGYTGSQTCGACSCGTATNPSCGAASLAAGSDYTCTGVAMIYSASRMCFPNGVYHPGISLGGSSATCPAQSAVSGTLTPTGPMTLCCF